ncbi:HEAT repeat domain-containing protein [Tessaracoccus sp. G1721]
MADLLEELAGVGYPVASVADLRSSGTRYRAAVPVLLRWLDRSEDTFEKEEIIRALSVPWARDDALDPLVALFRSAALTGQENELLRWAIGNALEVLWADSRFDELVALARDASFGKAREMIVLGLGRSKRSEASEALIELLDDAVVSGHAVMALRKLKVPEARPALQRMLDDDRAWVRKEAQRALAALD